MKNVSLNNHQSGETQVSVNEVKQALAQVLEQQQIVVQVNFTGDLAQLARILKPEIDVENSRRGMSLGKETVV